jgi:polyphenol oxidase
MVTTRAMPGASMGPFANFNLGSRCGDEADAVTANRHALKQLLDLPAPPRWLHQVHGTSSLRLTGEILQGEPEADAAFTSKTGAVLAVLTADCLPLLICARDGSEVGAIHAGWRGLCGGVIESCIARMSTGPRDLMVWLGPAIGAASFEVGDEVRDVFVAHAAGASAAFMPNRPGRWLCDLYTLATQRLRALQVAQIHGGGFDTFTDSRFYSHRRDHGRSGRFASLIWIDP